MTHGNTQPADDASGELPVAEARAYLDEVMKLYERARVEDPQVVEPARAVLEGLWQPDPHDPGLQNEPPTSPGLQATFEWEDQAEDGEDIGPLVVSDPVANEVVWETPDWVRLSEARSLAAAKRWQFFADGSSDRG